MDLHAHHDEPVDFETVQSQLRPILERIPWTETRLESVKSELSMWIEQYRARLLAPSATSPAIAEGSEPLEQAVPRLDPSTRYR